MKHLTDPDAQVQHNLYSYLKIDQIGIEPKTNEAKCQGIDTINQKNFIQLIRNQIIPITSPA